jgi:hypothetical protein
MSNIKEALRRYHESDASQRLHLYLQHRDLRPKFDEIEMHLVNQAREGNTGHKPVVNNRFCPPVAVMPQGSMGRVIVTVNSESSAGRRPFLSFYGKGNIPFCPRLLLLREVV